VKKFSAIIFDMDGVIVDSEPLHQKAFETLFEELGKKHDHGIVFDEYYGRSDGALLRDFIDKHKLPNELEDLSARKLKYFLSYLRERRPVFKELQVLVPELAQRYKLGVATSSSHHVADVVMEISGLGPHFNIIVAREDVRFPEARSRNLLHDRPKTGRPTIDLLRHQRQHSRHSGRQNGRHDLHRPRHQPPARKTLPRRPRRPEL
jgi:phosphoglycolate phosphatase-like HAD superfamily hydrolase